VSDDSDRRVVPLGEGRFDVLTGSRHRTAFAVRSGADTWVFLDGRVHVIRSAAPTSRRTGRGHGTVDDDVALAAPMPATVVSVHVAAGQQVTRGDVLITLEAMKMELSIKAPRDATVRRVECQPGELVQPGVALLELTS
jgi:biotin carboxyl carrier protein